MSETDTSRASPSPKELRSLLSYDERTGRLFWKVRDSSYFSSARVMGSWNSRYANKEAFTTISEGYRVGSVLNKTVKAHRVVWAIKKGEWPSGEIDHINGDRSDNRFENLRDVTPTQNRRNMKRVAKNKTGVAGVSHLPSGFLAKIGSKRIGVFRTLDSAKKARLKAEREEGYHENHGR